MGIFARKAARHASHSSKSVHALTGCVVMEKEVGVFDILFKNNVAISSGIEVVKVYMMK